MNYMGTKKEKKESRGLVDLLIALISVSKRKKRERKTETESTGLIKKCNLKAEQRRELLSCHLAQQHRGRS